MSPSAESRALAAARAGAGAVLLLRPEPLLALAGGRPPDRDARVFARILGGRHLVEAALLTALPSATGLRAGALVDAIHSVTTLFLAERDHHRRLAALNAVSAALLASAGLRVAAAEGRA